MSDPKWSSSVEDFRKGGALNNSRDVAARVNAVTFDTPSAPELRSGWKATLRDCLVCGRRLSNGASCCYRVCWHDLLIRFHGRLTLTEVAAMLLSDYWPIWEHYRRRAT